MRNSKAKRIQHLLVTHLMKCGQIQLRLPDGVILEIGITQEGKHGTEITDDYCFVKASREKNFALLDTYNVQLQCASDDICTETLTDEEGEVLQRVEIWK